jgi:PAS domain S-box-containing protein
LEQYPDSLKNEKTPQRIPEMDLEGWYEQIYDLSPSLCFVMNPEGLIIDCNLAFARGLGCRVKGEIQGKSILDCADEAHKETLQRSFDVWRNTGKIHNHEFKMRRADGSAFPALLNANSIHDEFGRIIACNAVILNVTELVNARKKVELAMNDLLIKERELYEINEELKRVERAKEEFLSMISHELKNPLTPIIAFTDILKKTIAAGGQLTERQLATIPMINQNAKEMRRLIEDVLSVYKLDMQLNFTFSETNIAELVNQVILELGSIFEEKGIKAGTGIMIAEDKSIINCDMMRIKQVLINLVRNAVDFLPNFEGKIIITLEEAEIDKIQSKDTASGIVVSIADNGTGIATDKVSGLFKKFYQADPHAARKYGGTGLGLTICKEIIEMHRGKIWYDTSYKGGACFKFYLPRIPR